MRTEADALIKRNKRMSSLERLQIYRESYWYRALGSLEDDFPGLRALVGPRTFRRLTEAYLFDTPSQSFTMRNLGSRMENWLSRHGEFAGANPTLALDMVRLEWAHIEAFDGAEKKPLGPEDLIELHEDLVVGLQPHISLLELSYAVDDLRIQVQDAATEAGSGATSNVAIGRKQRTIIRRYKKVQPSAAFLAVHRMNFVVYYRRLARDEFRVLRALQEGRTIAEAVGLIEEQSQNHLEGWFASWARMGWLCKPGSERNENEHSH